MPNHDVADIRTLMIEVFDTPARKNEIGIGLKLTPRSPLPLLCGLVQIQLVFQRQQNHPDCRHHLAHHNDANHIEIEIRMQTDIGKNLET